LVRCSAHIQAVKGRLLVSGELPGLRFRAVAGAGAPEFQFGNFAAPDADGAIPARRFGIADAEQDAELHLAAAGRRSTAVESASLRCGGNSEEDTGGPEQ